MHIGLIADGNRRWAKQNNLPTQQGHYQGFLTIKDHFLKTLQKHPHVTGCSVYAFSTENWKRSPLEVKNLLTMMDQIFTNWYPELLEQDIRIRHAGRTDRLPKKLLQQLQQAQSETAHKKFTLNLCLDYGGLDEICRTTQHLSHQGLKLTEKNITQHLDLPPLDLIIRTGGERRLSNFCLWQAAYAEFAFVDTFLPDMKQADFEQILSEFSARQRRKGT